MSSSVWDRAGIGLSALCLVHCLALPVLLAGLTVWAVAAESVHVALTVAVVPVAALAGARGYRRHRRAAVPALLAVGASLLVGALVLEGALGGVLYAAITVAGGLLLIAGHVLNARWRGACAA